MKRCKQICVAIFIYTLLYSCNTPQEVIYPEIRTITESVYASGKIKAKNEYKVYSTVSGIIDQVFIEEGDTVLIGQPLYKIEGDNTGLNKENARLAYELAKQNSAHNSTVIKELELQVQSAADRLEKDRLNFQRYKNLRSQNIGTDIELDQHELVFRTSQSAYDVAMARLEQTKTQLTNEKKRASNTYLMSNNTSSDYLVRSRMTGKVYAQYKNPGEMITTQEAIALIGDKHDFVAELLIDEADISKIKIGQQVSVLIDAFGEEHFQCMVTKIFPMLDTRTQTFRIEAEFLRMPSPLYPGLSLEANIVVNEKNNALVIPSMYLTKNKEVYIGSGEKIKVVTGLRNMEFVEIISGIDSTHTLLKPVE